MKFIGYALGAVAVAISLQSHACSVFLQSNIQLPLNAADVSNSDRLSLTRRYLTAREWTTEGASAEVDAVAFESEQNPKELAALRGKNVKTFLMRLGLDKDKIFVHERVIKLSKGKVDPDDKWQIGVEFVPNCPSSGCQNLCNTPKLQGVASYAVTADTLGPAPGSNSFTCGDKREPTKARILETQVWTVRTQEKSLTLVGNDSFGKQEPLSDICYRVTTSAREYIGMTDDQGRTERMQLLGPEHTKIEMKVDADRYPVNGQ
ncbi:hypothetical protein [Paraburkholderia sp. BL10I2N1]|uniref:hypothetical protein n=1 Tax=Paraburkholderia sp. BL10I2N1 TaxID=1938796 RepID=UPI0010610F2E|nr:hypothetical protein [Paraburkholderia sp. BL10I2N1]TDN70671.1 hypothetical protein B0G77_4159 [Paraburkholderia sp. BL10I2N1]